MDKNKEKRFIALIKDSSINKAELLRAMFQECSFEELNHIYDVVPTTYKGLVSLSFLCRKGYSEIYKTARLQPRKATIEYLGVLAFVFKHHAQRVNKYIHYREIIDRYALVGDYKNVHEWLDRINKEISYSYWTAIYEIKITRLEKGLSECTKIYNKHHYENQTIANYYYWCAYKSSSLDFPIGDENKLLVRSDVREFELLNKIIIAHCFPYLGLTEGTWMCSDLNSSIIDLYNNFINYLPYLSDETLTNEECQSYLHEICDVIDDEYLQKFCGLIGITNKRLTIEERVHIIDLYVEEKYKDVVNVAAKYIENAPYDFEILGYYLKSLICTNSIAPQFNKDGSIYDRVCYHYYGILNHGDDVQLHQKRLKDICRSQYHIHPLRYLFFVIDSLERRDLLALYTNLWKYTKYTSPLDVVVFEESKQKIEYVRSIGCLSSKWGNIFGIDNNSLSHDCWELTSSSFQETKIDVLTRKLKDGNIPIYLKDSVASYIINHYVEETRIEEAILLYVNSRLADKNLIVELCTDTIEQKIKSRDVRTTIPALELAIFYYMINADTDTIYLAYKRYLKIRGYGKASEISVNGDEKLKYFLSNIAIPKILSLHVLRFKSVPDVLEERKQICSNLYEYYHDKCYNDEISSIVLEQKLRELNTQVDESKIYVDVESIKSLEIQDVKALYDLYETTEPQIKYYREDFIKGFLEQLAEFSEPGMKMDGNVKIISMQNREDQEFINYRMELLTQMFCSVRDHFVSNPKYGLDYYLSTRIRHGTLVNKLRNHFELSNLVTNIENGEYQNNSFWTNRLELHENVVKSIFADFSANVDEIIRILKDEYIQVKTENESAKEYACFDFSLHYFYDKLSLLSEDDSIRCFDEWYSAVIDILWQHLESCLEQMRYVINQKQANLLGALHSLEKDLMSSYKGRTPATRELHDTISRCQNDIQIDIQTITGWFKRRSSEDFDFTMRQVVDTCLSSINSSNRARLRPLIQCSSETVLNGTYFSTLYDIFHDLFNNILDYSVKSEQLGDCKVMIVEEENFIKMDVRNKIREQDQESLQMKINTINTGLENRVRHGGSKSEGNSGCIKIFNAVNNHLNSRNNSYTNLLDDCSFVAKIQIEINPIKRII